MVHESIHGADDAGVKAVTIKKNQNDMLLRTRAGEEVWRYGDASSSGRACFLLGDLGRM
jgi:hypothetical protein